MSDGERGPDGGAGWSEYSAAVPGFLRERAAAWAAGARPEVVPARAASTVLLLRPSRRGRAVAEVFVLRRVSTMAFAPDLLAFPGGGVDPRDADADPPWHGPSAAAWAERLGVPDEGTARGLVVAAARELFEECGVLLAGDGVGSLVPDVTGADWQAERAALLDRSQSFSEVLTRRGLVLRADLLHARARWVTPACEPRRYDTWFFTAAVPPGQVPDDRSSEAAHADWVDPAEVLRADDGGSALMLPPTRALLESVAGANAVEELLRTLPRHDLGPVEPEPVADAGPDGVRLRIRVPVTGPDLMDAPDGV